MQFYRKTDRGVELYIRLSPGASRNRIGGVYQDADGQEWVKAFVTSPPEDNKANKALVAFLAKQLKIPKTRIGIISGQTSRSKILLLDEINLDQHLEKVLESFKDTEL